MVILLVLPFLDPKHSMASIVFMPSFTWPKTTRMLFSHSVLAVWMKNWEAFVLVPAFAMDKTPDPVLQDEILIIRYLPVNGLPASAIWHMKSPPWHINPEIIL